MQESQAPAAPRLLLPQHRGFSRKFGFCLPLNRAACSREPMAPAAFRPLLGSSTLLPASPAVCSKAPVPETRCVRADEGRSPSCCPVVFTLSDLMGKPWCPRGLLLLIQAQRAPESSTPWFLLSCELPRGSPRLIPACGHRLKHDLPSSGQNLNQPTKDTAATHPQWVSLGLCCDHPYRQELPRATESHLRSCSHFISVARQVLAILVWHWVPGTHKPGAELSVPRS